MAPLFAKNLACKAVRPRTIACKAFRQRTMNDERQRCIAKRTMEAMATSDSSCEFKVIQVSNCHRRGDNPPALTYRSDRAVLASTPRHEPALLPSLPTALPLLIDKEASRTPPTSQRRPRNVDDIILILRALIKLLLRIAELLLAASHPLPRQKLLPLQLRSMNNLLRTFPSLLSPSRYPSPANRAGPSTTDEWVPFAPNADENGVEEVVEEGEAEGYDVPDCS